MCFKVYGGAVVWDSKKQTATATSTVEAEFRAASHAVKEAIWLRGLLEELHIPVGKVPLFCDNAGCIQNLKNPVNSKYTKHVAVAFHHARSAVIQGQVDIRYINTVDNVSDIFTKPLVPVLFLKHRDTLGVVPGGNKVEVEEVLGQ
ncbi:MAG: Ty1/Copia family ribonuclease HI [Cyanobacteria bacterium]|nr:Ty1/Copia family ribonuclease HI [Cyanobacteriota bacterium]